MFPLKFELNFVTVTFSTETLNLLIDGFIQHIESKPDQIENLLKCWHKAVQVGVKVDAVSYQLLASAFQLIGDEENEDKCNQIAKLMDQVRKACQCMNVLSVMYSNTEF
jgi:hypothetical protein